MKKSKAIIITLFLCTLLVNIKSVFTDYNPDAGYAVAMAQRLADGDGLFIKMWEPHQTAAFFMAGLMRIYESVLGTRDGIVVFLNFVNFFLFLGLAFIFIKTFSKCVNKEVAWLISIFILALRPKMMQIPDYANLCILFSSLCFIFLLRFFLEGGRLWNLIAATIFLCLNILAYPSFLVLYIGVIITLVKYSSKRRRDILTVTGICAFLGLSYVGVVIIRLGPMETIQRIMLIISGDSHSKEAVYAGFKYYKETLAGFATLALSIVTARIIATIIKRTCKKKEADHTFILSIVLTIFIILERIMAPTFLNDISAANWAMDKIILIIMIIFGFFGYKYLGEEQKVVYNTAMIVEACTLIAVISLTNLPLITVFGYTHVAVTASFMSLSAKRMREPATEKERPERKPMSCLAVSCIVVLIVSQGILNLDKVENYVRTGPLKWCITTLSECNKNRISAEEWAKNVLDSDKVLIAQEFGIDPIYYLFSKAKIATHSTISTPTMGEELKKYWKIYPDREPTVIAIPCWEGEEDRHIPEWLSEKISKEYDMVEAGTYWNFYRKY